MPKSSERLEKEALLFAAIDAGKSVNAAANDVGIDRRRAYAWNKARTAAVTPDEVAAPKPPTPTPSEPTKTGRKGTRPITEKTAAKLLELAFLIPAMRTNEPLWLLDDFEKEALGGPLADSLSMVPTPIADVINTYSAPGVFIGSLIGVINAKQRRIAEKAARPTRPPGPQGVPPRAPQPQPAPPKPVPPIVDLADAVAAAKGGLSDLDEAPDVERELH